LRFRSAGRDPLVATEPVIHREEVVRLLSATYDMSETLRDILAVLREEADGEEDDEG